MNEEGIDIQMDDEQPAATQQQQQQQQQPAAAPQAQPQIVEQQQPAQAIAGFGDVQVVSDDDLRALEQRVQQLTQQFNNNPQDAQVYADLITAKAELNALKRVKSQVEPVLLRQQAVQQAQVILPAIEQQLAKRIPQFDNLKGEFERLFVAAVQSTPEVLRDPQALNVTAELVLGQIMLRRQMSGEASNPVPQDMSQQVAPQAPQGNEPTQQGGLTPDLQQAYEQAKQFYPDLTPEEFAQYQPTESEYDLKFNAGGKS